MDGTRPRIHLVGIAVKRNRLDAVVGQDIAHLHHRIQGEFVPGRICAEVHLIHHIIIVEPLLNHPFKLKADLLRRGLRQHQHGIGNHKAAPGLRCVRPRNLTPAEHIHTEPLIDDRLIGIPYPVIDKLRILLPQIPLGPCQHMEQQRRIRQAHQPITAIVGIKIMLYKCPVRIITISGCTVLQQFRHGFLNHCKVGRILAQDCPIHMRPHTPGCICPRIP